MHTVYTECQASGAIRKRQRGSEAAARTTLTQSSLYFLGLFDTVASLYGKRFTGESIHVISLPQSVHRPHVYHAIALDENRRSFQSVVFPSAPKEGRLVEKWFSRAHANVGGGYVFDPLSVLPLRWMIESASNVAGLRFRGIPDISVDEVLLARERNSYQEFA